MRRWWPLTASSLEISECVTNHARRSRGEIKDKLPPLPVRPSLTALRAAQPRGSAGAGKRRRGEAQARGSARRGEAQGAGKRKARGSARRGEAQGAGKRRRGEAQGAGKRRRGEAQARGSAGAGKRRRGEAQARGSGAISHSTCGAISHSTCGAKSIFFVSISQDWPGKRFVQCSYTKTRR